MPALKTGGRKKTVEINGQELTLKSLKGEDLFEYLEAAEYVREGYDGEKVRSRDISKEGRKKILEFVELVVVRSTEDDEDVSEENAREFAQENFSALLIPCIEVQEGE